MTPTTAKRLLIAGAVTLALAAAGCGSSSSSSGKTTGGAGAPNTKVKGNLSFTGVWSGAEQKAFQAVLDGFKKRFPNVNVRYTSGGDQLPTLLSTAVQGGNPPDLASVPQPGLVRQFAERGALKPIDFAKPTISANFPKGVVDIGSDRGKLYGLLFKAANKSTVWYNVPLFKQAGIKPPATFPQLLADAKTLKASGTKAYSIGVDVGFPITDLFENVYLRQAGPQKYDQLAAHKIAWTDPSVKQALGTVAKILGDRSNIAGGASGALQADFPKSVSQAFSSPPQAATVFEGDFVPSVILSQTKAKPVTGFNFFPFPSINGSPAEVVAGGDSVVMFRNTPAARALVSYLATPQAAEIWAKLGGFSSANNKVNASAYPDPITRRAALAVATAKAFRFDLSDQAPAAFGATPGQGEFQLFSDFTKNLNVNQTASALEQAAAKAYGKGG